MAKRHSGRAGRIVVAVSATLAIAIGLGAGAFAALVYSWRNIAVDKNFEPVYDSDESAPSATCSEPCNILLLGSDSRIGLSADQQGQFGANQDLGGSARADTIMLVH